VLQSTLELLRDRLDAALQAADPRSEEWVVLANPVDIDGHSMERARNKMVVALVGLHLDVSTISPPSPGAGQFASTTPPNLNALVLFAANFSDSNYPTGLGMLSRTIEFFQQNPVFTHHRQHGRAGETDRITMHFVSLDLTQTSDLMRMLGLNYLPCALYEVGMLPGAESIAAGELPAVGTRPVESGAGQGRSGGEPNSPLTSRQPPLSPAGRP
jgi:hypothetical protein